MSAAGEPRSIHEQTEEDITEIALVLLKEHPPGTPMSVVWEEALTLYRVRFETEVLPADSD